MAKAPVQTQPVSPTGATGAMAEIGVSGLRIASGYLFEEFLRDLAGDQGRRIYRQMTDNDSTVGAVLHAVSLTLRKAKWTAEPNPDAPNQAQAQAEADFAESILGDMSHTWGDFISEVLSMLSYGWAYHEIVIKRRVGPLETDPSKKSNYDDGRIGVRKLAPRSQDSILKWEMQEDGGIAGMWQLPPIGGGTYFIPIERALLFRTTSRKNSPEGLSMLRTAYRPWYFLTRIQEIEAIGIERELAGIPVIKIPAAYFEPTAPAAVKDVLRQYTDIARDLKFNEQGGLVIPSDMWLNPGDNSVSSAPLVSIELLRAAGTRSIDPSAAKGSYQRDIANSMLAGFILLGNDSRGSYALSKDKTDFFVQAAEAVLDGIEDVLNRHLLTRIWDWNGLDRALMPQYRHGKVTATDLGVLGAFIQAISAGGATLFPDDELENALRTEADLPLKTEEAIQQQQDEKDDATAAAQALAAARTPPPSDKGGNPTGDKGGAGPSPAGADAGTQGESK